MADPASVVVNGSVGSFFSRQQVASAGNYFVAIQRSSTTAGGSNIGLGISALMVTQHNSTIALPNNASNSSNQLVPYLGSWSTNTLGATTSSIARANVSTSASHPIPIFQMMREA